MESQIVKQCGHDIRSADQSTINNENYRRDYIYISFPFRQLMDIPRACPHTWTTKGKSIHVPFGQMSLLTWLLINCYSPIHVNFLSNGTSKLWRQSENDWTNLVISLWLDKRESFRFYTVPLQDIWIIKSLGKAKREIIDFTCYQHL